MSEKINEDVKVKIAEAISPLTSVFHEIGEEPLAVVKYVYVDGCLERIVFAFGPISLLVLANEDDDTVALWTTNTDCWDPNQGTDMNHDEVWKPFIGQRFGWGYILVNQQDYCDGVLLGFGDILPKVLLQVVASSIKIRAISEPTR